MKSMMMCQCVVFTLISLLLFPSHFDIVNGSCFTGIIQSTESGDISILDRDNLVEDDCGPTPIPTTQGPTTGATTEVPTTAPTTEALMTTAATTPEAITTTLSPFTVPKTTTTPPPPKATATATKPPPGRRRRDAASKTTKAPAPTTATAAPVSPVSCAYFKFFKDKLLKENGTWQANFTCMADCKSDNNFTLNGKQGKLQCCNEDNCNGLLQFMKNENVNFHPVESCWMGNSSIENGVKVKRCQNGESFFCFNHTTTDVDSGNDTTMYSCSDRTIDKICLDNDLNAIDGKCTSLPGKNPDVNDTVCCCPWGNCNYHKSGPPPTHPPVTVGPAPSSHGLGKGVIAGLVFMGFFIGFVAGCYCFKRNKRQQEGVDFNYSRITADSTEDAEC